MAAAPLLDPDERDPVTVENESGDSVFFFTCEHAGRVFPASSAHSAYRRLRLCGTLHGISVSAPSGRSCRGC